MKTWTLAAVLLHAGAGAGEIGRGNLGYGLGGDNAIAGLKLEYRAPERFLLNVGLCLVYPVYSAAVGWVVHEGAHSAWDVKIGPIVSSDFTGVYGGFSWIHDFGANRGFAWQIGANLHYWKFRKSKIEENDASRLVLPYPALTLNYLW
jgi:hypothetical protein